MRQTLDARTKAIEKSGSAVANSRAAKPGNDGKFIEARMPPAFMSLHAARADLIQALRLKAVLVLRPARHRVQRRIRDYRVPERPHVGPLITSHHLRGSGVPPPPL